MCSGAMDHDLMHQMPEVQAHAGLSSALRPAQPGAGLVGGGWIRKGTSTLPGVRAKTTLFRSLFYQHKDLVGHFPGLGVENGITPGFFQVSDHLLDISHIKVGTGQIDPDPGGSVKP